MDEEKLTFCQRLIHYRKDHPVFRRRRFFQGRPIHGSKIHDIAWFTLEGEQMAEHHWGHDYAKSLGMFLNGKVIPNPHPRGEPVTDDDFYIIFNAYHEPLSFTLPVIDGKHAWQMELDTMTGWLKEDKARKAGDKVEVEARSIVLLRHRE
jgi:glycogen operon protein